MSIQLWVGEVDVFSLRGSEKALTLDLLDQLDHGYFVLCSNLEE